MPRKEQLLKKVKQTKVFLPNLIKFNFYQKANIPLIVNIYLISASLLVFALGSKKLRGKSDLEDKLDFCGQLFYRFTNRNT